MYEALEDAGFVAGAINITCYRGRHRYVPTVPGLRRPVHGPSRFFFYNLYESDRTGAPWVGRGRKVGAVDAYAAGVGRWLVTRDGFDFLVYYLSDYDYASHEHGPVGAIDVALERVDASVGALLDAAGGPDEFLERYAVILLSDHGQTEVERVARLEPRFADLKGQVVVTASNRAGQVYLLPGARVDAAELARRLDGEPAVEVTLRREGGRGGRAARRRGLSGERARASRRGRARPRRAREPERRRAARLGGRGLGARRPRRPPPRGRRQPRLARRGRLVRPAPHDRRRCVRPARITEVVPAVLDHFGVPRAG